MQLLSTDSDNPIVWTILGTGSAVYIIHSIVQKILNKKNIKEPPFYYEYPYIPWLGSLVQFAIQPREFLQRAYKNCNSDVFTIQLFGKKMTFLFGVDGHSHFFRTKEDVFDIRKAYAMTVTTFGPNVCYDVSQSRMAEQFAFFKDGLSDNAFIKYMKFVHEEVERYFNTEWGDTGEADLLQSLSEVFTLTSSRCLLGEEIRKRWNDSGMAEHYLALDHSFVPILFFFPWIPNPNRSKCVKARKLFEKIFREVIEEREERKRSEGDKYVKPDDFLQNLIDATYKDGTKPNIQEIAGILIGVLLGGQHTSNTTGTWIIIHLLKSTEWYNKIMKEQESILGKDLLSPSTLTYDDVQKMTIFEAVMSETLRLHHPFFQLSRYVQKDSEFQGKVIPAGHYVNVAPSAAMRLLFDDGDTFNPNRFLNGNKPDPYTFIPFGGGMHQCGGRKFAWNSLKASLTWLLRNYEIELIGAGATSMPNEDYTTMVVAPTRPHVQVRYKRRK